MNYAIEILEQEKERFDVLSRKADQEKNPDYTKKVFKRRKELTEAIIDLTDKYETTK